MRACGVFSWLRDCELGPRKSIQEHLEPPLPESFPRTARPGSQGWSSTRPLFWRGPSAYTSPVINTASSQFGGNGKVLTAAVSHGPEPVAMETGVT